MRSPAPGPPSPPAQRGQMILVPTARARYRTRKDNQRYAAVCRHRARRDTAWRPAAAEGEEHRRGHLGGRRRAPRTGHRLDRFDRLSLVAARPAGRPDRPCAEPGAAGGSRLRLSCRRYSGRSRHRPDDCGQVVRGRGRRSHGGHRRRDRARRPARRQRRAHREGGQTESGHAFRRAGDWRFDD